MFACCHWAKKFCLFRKLFLSLASKTLHSWLNYNSWCHEIICKLTQSRQLKLELLRKLNLNNFSVLQLKRSKQNERNYSTHILCECRDLNDEQNSLMSSSHASELAKLSALVNNAWAAFMQNKLSKITHGYVERNFKTHQHSRQLKVNYYQVRCKAIRRNEVAFKDY